MKYPPNLALTLLIITIFIVVQLNNTENSRVQAQDLAKSGRLQKYFALLKQTPGQATSYARELITSIPFGKILLAGGALLSVFFLFVRLLVVLGPILILGALTRESTDATDLLRMLIEFYNQVIVALDEQMIQSEGLAA